MLHSKAHYKALPTINGYKWCLFDSDENLHYFTKGNNRTGFATVKLVEDAVNDSDLFTWLLENDYSKLA